MNEDIQQGWYTKHKVDKMRKKAYKTQRIELSDGEIDLTYSLRVGDVWLGTLKKQVEIDK